MSTREPGATPLGKRLRALVVDDQERGDSLAEEDRPTGWAEAFVFEADRAQTYARIIRPAIERGQCVVSDRNLYGTIAYQVFGGYLDLSLVDAMNSAAVGETWPDVILVLDLDPSAGIKRKRAQDQVDRFDARNPEFQQRVREGYLFAARRDPDRAFVVDAGRSQEDVLGEVRGILTQTLGQRYPMLRGRTND